MSPVLSGEEIRDAMRRKGIRQVDLAQKLKVSSATINNVLHGRSTPGGKLARALVEELELQLEKTSAIPSRCPFVNSFLVRQAVSAYDMARRLAEALVVAVIANLLTK